MDATLPLLGFLAVFHVIGGVALGTAVRHWIRRRFGCNTIYIAVWGTLFGGGPFVIGIIQFASAGALALIIVEVGIFLAAVFVTALIPDWFVESFSVPTIMPIAFGGVFLLIGVIAGIALAQSGELSAAIISFAVFAGLGGFVFVSGLKTLMKG